MNSLDYSRDQISNNRVKHRRDRARGDELFYFLVMRFAGQHGRTIAVRPRARRM